LRQHVRAQKRLVPLFDASRATTVQGHFLVYPARHAKRAEIETFVHWLQREAQSRAQPLAAHKR